MSETQTVEDVKPLLKDADGDAYEKKFKVPWREVQRAIDQGYIIPEWGLADYVRATVKGDPNDAFAKKGLKKLGYQNINTWGVQGATKSNFDWQLLNVLYQDWETSFSRIVVNLDDLIRCYNLVRGLHLRLPGLVIDDFTTLVPKQLWFVDKDLHILLQQFLAVMRTKIGTVITNCPNIEFTWESLGEVVTIEVIVYPNGWYKAERYCWDVDPEHPLKARFSKVVIEYAKYNPLAIPLNWWKQYQEKREGMADTVFGRLVDHWSGGNEQKQEDIRKQAHKMFKEIIGVGKSRTIDAMRAKGFKGNTEKTYDTLRILEEVWAEQFGEWKEKNPS